MDLNVDPAWSNGFSGTGVVISILDDGIDHQHQDLISNYDSEASTDLNDLDDMEQDPMPNKNNTLNSHGTRCAGEIAATGHNDVCGVGVAFTAHIGGVRILDGRITDALEAQALNFNMDYIDIYSASWGPKDDGITLEGPGKFAREALKKGVEEGRGGLGSIYVWATGNGGLYEDDCGADGYVSSIESMSFGSVNENGERPYFMEICSSTLAVVPSGGEVYKGEEKDKGITKLKVVTTDINGGCIENFLGTSTAAPLAAGCVALALQANPFLTWRDVQHIVVHSSRIPSEDHSWVVNGAGLHVSHKFGFGVLDASRMVHLAQNWVTVPQQNICRYRQLNVYKKITARSKIVDEVEVTGCKGAKNRIHNLEHVQVKIKLQHSRRGDIQLTLVSPSGTKSQILSPRPNDDSQNGIDFTFMTVHSWSENPQGKWQLYVEDIPQDLTRNNNVGELEEWSLILYGTGDSRGNRMTTTFEQTNKTYVPTRKELKNAMDREQARTKEVNITPYQSIPVEKKSDGQADSKFVEDLIRALKNAKMGSTTSNQALGSADKRNMKSEYSSDWNRGDYLTEVKKSYDQDQMLDDNVLDELVDAMEKELGTNSKSYKRTSEAEMTEDDLEDVLDKLRRRLQLNGRLIKQKDHQRKLDEEKKQQQLLRELLEEVKKDEEEDLKAAHELKRKITSQPSDDLDTLLEEARKMLQQKERKQVFRGAGVDAKDERASKIDKGVEKVTIRTLKDLLNYLADKK
ncbi:proprotein convertase subtilisin/kexin type 4-like isoform X2 [Haliotis asinina]